MLYVPRHLPNKLEYKVLSCISAPPKGPVGRVLLCLTEFILPPPHPSVKESYPRVDDSYDQSTLTWSFRSVQVNLTCRRAVLVAESILGYPRIALFRARKLTRIPTVPNCSEL